MKLSESAEAIAKSRYFMNEDEDWQGCCERVGEYIGQADNSQYGAKFSQMIYDMDFLPGGRILRNSGRTRGSLYNCFSLPCGDSIEQIGQFLKEALMLWSSGGGVGTNFSQLRPVGDKILGKGGTSSGLVSFIEAADAVANTVESGGARRAAGLALVDISHPEVMDFIDAKLTDKKLSHFNISVAINDDFLTAVEKNEDWTFKFKQKTYGSMSARKIWNKILVNMIESAEPGLVNWTNFSKNNSYFWEPIHSPNPCGEVCLEAHGSCNLGSLVLPSFITGSKNTNWKKLEEVIKLSIRFLDNVIDVNKHNLKEIEIKAQNGRRIGLGVMGLGSYLFSKQVKYGSEKSIYEIEKLFKFIRDTSYHASIEIAQEKGAFAKFEPVAYGKASFIRKLPVSIRMDIKKYGIRNVTLMAMAPTGTISLLAETTSGIEPLPVKAYRRKDRVSERVYVNDIYQKSLEENKKCPSWLVDIFDLKPEEHLEVQATIQKYVDGAVSKTINLPSTTTKKDLDKLLLEYIHDLKGVTVYRDGSREGQIINPMSEKEVRAYLKKKMKISNSLSKEDVKCSSGTCDV